MSLSRRAMLAGAASTMATATFANAPLTSPRPRPRVANTGSAARIIGRAGLSGDVGFVIADARSGDVLEAVSPDLDLPPASVAKAVTALYAIETLGASFQYETRLLADGPCIDGVVDGNLILVGGGDPNLVTDQLFELAEGLKATGLREVNGDFLVWDGGLTNLDEIDPTQLDHVGYNPTVTGLNLNFNRVHFEWKRAGGQYTTALDARSAAHRPVVTTARMRVVDRSAPVFTYRSVNSVDEWTVARGALNNGGSRWLPVRNPALYAGEVFSTFAESNGIILKAPREVTDLPRGQELTQIKSVPLDRMMRDMLRFSTNITAEAAGLSATAARSGQNRSLRTSAVGMNHWVQARTGALPNFIDHSGLGDASRIAAGDMVQFLTADGVLSTLRPLMKQIDIVDRNRNVIRKHPGQVLAKTGTLNFVSSLAGYLTTAGGRNVAFAFFGADLEAREVGKLAGNESPRGASSWNRQAKALQQQLLQNWIRWG